MTQVKEILKRTPVYRKHIARPSTLIKEARDKGATLGQQLMMLKEAKIKIKVKQTPAFKEFLKGYLKGKPGAGKRFASAVGKGSLAYGAPLAIGLPILAHYGSKAREKGLKELAKSEAKGEQKDVRKEQQKTEEFSTPLAGLAGAVPGGVGGYYGAGYLGIDRLAGVLGGAAATSIAAMVIAEQLKKRK